MQKAGFSDHFYSVKFLHTLLGRTLASYIQILSRTCHFNVEGEEHYMAAIGSNRPVLYALWHQQLMPLMDFVCRVFDLKNFVFIVEGENRGRILAKMATTLNAHKVVQVDMQGNPTLAARQVIHIIKSMEAGKYSMLTPDGPYGPAFEQKPGTAFIARKSNAVVVPCGAWASTAYQLKRWDRYLILFPYTQVTVVFQKPIYVDNDMSRSQLETSLNNEMHMARRRAQALTYTLPS